MDNGVAFPGPGGQDRAKERMNDVIKVSFSNVAHIISRQSQSLSELRGKVNHLEDKVELLQDLLKETKEKLNAPRDFPPDG